VKQLTQHFIPNISLEEAIPEDSIGDVLSDSQFATSFYKRDELAHLIAKGGRKTLAILVLIGMEKAILKFVETDQLQMFDLKLPLDIAKAV
jgi:hypothetical protein